MPIELGQEAKDTITGFQGVVICVAQWLHGCRRLTIQPRELRDGKPVECCTFDEPQLLEITSVAEPSTSEAGGPRPEPRRQSAPK